jgi:hypothetical protein
VAIWGVVWKDQNQIAAQKRFAMTRGKTNYLTKEGVTSPAKE